MPAGFVLDQKDFDYLRALVGERTGIALGGGKREMVAGRLARRLRRLGLRGFGDYCARLRSGDEAELVEMTNCITTNVTSFFREPHHFERLQQELLPALDERLPAGAPVCVWSAGCSTGEEPYSIAIACLEALGDRRPVRVLATDLDTDVLARARRGVYPIEGLRVDEARRRRFFRRGSGDNHGLARVRPEVQALVTFRQLNLVEPFGLRSRYHVLFCRNVVIYFNAATRRALFDRMADQMAADGTLFVGHSESLLSVTDRFELVGPTTYRRLR